MVIQQFPTKRQIRDSPRIQLDLLVHDILTRGMSS